VVQYNVVGVLDGDVKLKPDAHVFVANKADWIEICDNLPQFKKDRGE